MPRIAIVGGGVTGLTAAYLLGKKGHQITVFEKEKELGGLASSFKEKGWAWPLERYYHHLFASDRDIFRLVKELNLEKKLFFRRPKTSVFLGGKIFRFDNPQSILLFPKLGVIDKVRMGLVTALLKVNPWWRPLEKITASDFLLKTMGERNFHLIWEPLFKSKFGPLSDQIPASWFWTRIKKRSFSLGYFEGGTQTLIDELVGKIKTNGGEILTGKEIDRIDREGEKFTLYFNGKVYPSVFDQVIVTVPPEVLLKMFSLVSSEEKKQLNSFKNLGSLCLVLSLKESFLKDGTYWLNINEPDFPFVAIVEHTNFMDKENYNGDFILYIGGYYPTDHPYFQQDSQSIFKQFLPFLQRVNPNFDFKKSLIDLRLFKAVYSQPVPGVNYSQNLPKVTTSVPGFYWGSLHHVYPEDRGINYAVKLGRKIVNEVENS